MELLGVGGMGTVFRAVDERSGATVALKVLKSQLVGSAEWERRFLREASAARELRHRHLVRVLDEGRAGGRRYLAVEFIEGHTLRARIARDGPLPVDEIVRITGQVGSALDAIHAAGLVHRDVKPENIMLDARGVAFLGDFGLAKGPAYSVLTAVGEVMGTAAYLAPELIRGDEEATPVTDVYALGATVYECLAGEPPFETSSLYGIAIRRLETEPPDIRSVRPDVPRTVAGVLIRALAVDPSERFRTGHALATVLNAATRPMRSSCSPESA